MLLTQKQQAEFWRLWAEACSVQGWMGGEKEMRRHELLESLGFRSLKEVNRKEGYTALKAAVNRLAYRLEGGLEDAFPGVLHEMRQHVWVIRHKLMPELAFLVPDAEAYVRRIVADKFGCSAPWDRLAEHPVRGPHQIRQLLYTLTRAIHRLKKTERQAEDQAALDALNLDKPSVVPLSDRPFGQTVAAVDVVGLSSRK